MTDWYYHAPATGHRVGPLALDQLRRHHRDGRIPSDALLWRDGMAEWQPLQQLSAELQLDAGSADSASSTGDGERSPYAPPDAALLHEQAVHADAEVVYAGFWKRFAALMIDTLVVSMAYYALVAVGAFAGLATASTVDPGTLGIAMIGLVYLIYPLLSGLYFVLLESSSAQATLGKMAVGIKVADRDGRRLGRLHALGRWVSHVLCYFTLYIGYLMAAFTDRKRGLHDMVAGTLVADRWAWTATPERQRRELGAVTIIVLVLGLGLMLIYLAVILAIALPAYQDYVQRAA